MPINMIPSELKIKKQWTYSFSDEELKRPKHHQYIPDGALLYDDATRLAGSTKHVGFYVTQEDAYIMGDLDHIEDPANPWAKLPIAVSDFLQSKETYIESSPSGEGLRFFLRFKTAEEKKKLTGSYYHVRSEIHKEIKEMQVNVSQPWMTVTGKAMPYAYDKVAVVTIEELNEVFDLKLQDKADADAVERSKTEKTEDQMDSLSSVKQKLMALPWDQNPRAQRAYEKVFGGAYQHYDYWLKVMMATHDYGTKTNTMIECLEAFTDWSSLDALAFSGEEDVANHWRSLSDKKEKIGYRSLHALFYANQLRWPKPVARTKAEVNNGVKPKPMVGNFSNFMTLINYYGLVLYRDETDPNQLYLEGDEDILTKFFLKHRVEMEYERFYGPFTEKTLTPAVYEFAQFYGFYNVNMNQIKQFVTAWLANTKLMINLIKYYFDTPFERLPKAYRENEDTLEISDLSYAFSCLELDPVLKGPLLKQELDLYFRYYSCWILGLTKNLYYSNNKYLNNCILLLTGEEQRRKTSHFTRMLPTFMREKIRATPHGFANPSDVRDISKMAAQSLMIVWDEIDKHLSAATESNFKSLLDNMPQTIIDKYETIPRTVYPSAIYGATSNKREFRLGDTGSRRLFHIPIAFVDTDKMDTINWHTIINQCRDTIDKAIEKGMPMPWLLTEKELEFQRELQLNLRAKNNLDLLLEDLFEFDTQLPVGYTTIPGVGSLQTDKTGRFMSTGQIIEILARAGHTQANRAQLHKTLQRLCGSFSRTMRGSKSLTKPKCIIEKGEASQAGKRRWVMPDRKKENQFGQFNE